MIDAHTQILQRLDKLLGAAGDPSGTSAMTVTVKNGSSFSIPAFDYIGFAYVGVTNNIDTQTFKSGGSTGTTVATLKYTYVGAGASDDDDISSITQS